MTPGVHNPCNKPRIILMRQWKKNQNASLFRELVCLSLKEKKEGGVRPEKKYDCLQIFFFNNMILVCLSCSIVNSYIKL